ncbi:MAG: DUF1761 domain-containing protein [Bacteroidota bacterium]
MLPTNFYLYFLTALIPLLIGAIYYHPKVLGGIWQRTNKFTDEYIASGNMPLIFGLTCLFGLMLSAFLPSLIIHQTNVASIMMPEIMESGSAVQSEFNTFMDTYGDRFRGFKHGVAHGFFTTLFFVLPIIAINALFERRGWKYIAIHSGYWALVLMLMGGVLCEFLAYVPVS